MNKLWMLPVLLAVNTVALADCKSDIKKLRTNIISQSDHMDSEEIEKVRAEMKEAFSKSEDGLEDQCEKLLAPLKEKYAESKDK